MLIGSGQGGFWFRSSSASFYMLRKCERYGYIYVRPPLTWLMATWGEGHGRPPRCTWVHWHWGAYSAVYSVPSHYISFVFPLVVYAILRCVHIVKQCPADKHRYHIIGEAGWRRKRWNDESRSGNKQWYQMRLYTNFFPLFTRQGQQTYSKVMSTGNTQVCKSVCVLGRLVVIASV